MAKKNELKGKTILLTRQNNEALRNILCARGASVLEIPLIKTEHSAREEDVRDAMDEMGHYDWITFSSANGVRGFFTEFFKRYDDIRSIGFARIACVGEATATELKKFYLKADVIPDTATGDAMIEKMAEYETLENLKILCVSGNLSPRETVKKLETLHNAIADTITVYKTEGAVIADENADVKKFRKSGADAVVFASPSAVESFLRNASKLSTSANAKQPKIISIGTTTSAALKKKALPIAAESPSPTPESLADTITQTLSKA